jgi:hypothetical protein
VLNDPLPLLLFFQYEIGMVTADGGAKILEPKKLTSKWEIATTHCDYE